MTRLIDADAIKNLEWITERGTADCGEEFVYMSAINKMPTVEAIPIDFIKFESQRVYEMIESAAEEGNIKEVDRLCTIMATLDAVISNWIYTTGEEWRKKNERPNR